MTNKQALKHYGSWANLRAQLGYSRQRTHYWEKTGRISAEGQLEIQKDLERKKGMKK
jgi:hypothetical protein